jgi:hypothetical protein
VDFEVTGAIINPVTIAAGSAVRDRRRLRREYGGRRWLKRKGLATVRLPDGRVLIAEIHWYEAHGIGKREIKVKRLFEEAP